MPIKGAANDHRRNLGILLQASIPRIGNADMKRSRFTRRQLIQGVGTSLGILALRGFEAYANAPVHFSHGVASGDPLADRVILWTRLIPGEGQHGDLSCRWEVARDAGFKQQVRSGSTATNAARDYTIKVDVTGLSADSRYFYRFVSGAVSSPVGLTRTLPEGDVEEFRVGVCSCSNYPQGYFNVYRHMAQSDLNLVLHLGDYIYEYAEGVYANPVATDKLKRQVQPPGEIVALEDYRMRYGLYRTDQDLQAVHARHPFICVWDDHEFANDCWRAGAENHQQNEGSFAARARSARQAYHEWMPIRTPSLGDQEAIYRHFNIGNLADLFMLDTRVHGRDRPLDYAVDLPLISKLYDISAEQPTAIDDHSQTQTSPDQLRRINLPFDFATGAPVPITEYQRIKDLTHETLPNNWHYLPDTASFRQRALVDPEKTILGYDQEQWLASGLRDSQKTGSTWQLLGQQVLMGKLVIPALTDEQLKLDSVKPEYQAILKMMQVLAKDHMPFNLDAWDGYASCRDRVFASLTEFGSNPIVLAGDTHNAWAFNLADARGEAVAVEIGTPSVNSPGLETYLATEPAVLANAIRDVSNELVAADTAHRGWSELVLTPATATCQWHFVDTVLQREFSVSSSETLVCRAGDKQFSRG